MTATTIARALGGARRGADGWWTCRCPAHPDRTPSLSLRDGARGPIVKCWAGLPAKPQIDQDGRVKQLEGRTQYVRMLEFSSRDRSDKFSAEVVKLVKDQHPRALD